MRNVKEEEDGRKNIVFFLTQRGPGEVRSVESVRSVLAPEQRGACFYAPGKKPFRCSSSEASTRVERPEIDTLPVVGHTSSSGILNAGQKTSVASVSLTLPVIPVNLQTEAISASEVQETQQTVWCLGFSQM